MNTTSKRIQEAMDLRGLKQVDLVEKTGISKGALSSYLSGRYVPKQYNTFLIAKALNVSEAWLSGADIPMERDSYNDQWDKEAEQFSDSVNSFHNELNSLGWTCEWIDKDEKYLLSNGNISFKISPDEYSSFREDVDTFYKTRLKMLYEKSKVSLFPLDEGFLTTPTRTDDKNSPTDQQLDDEVYEVAAAHAINASPEQKKHADDIMKDPSEWE